MYDEKTSIDDLIKIITEMTEMCHPPMNEVFEGMYLCLKTMVENIEKNEAIKEMFDQQ